MRFDVVSPKSITSSFFKCEEDIQKFIQILFSYLPKEGRELKKLLVVDKTDCLQNSQYDNYVDQLNISDLISQGYVKINNLIKREQFQTVKTYMIVTLDSFTPNAINNEYLDYTLWIDIISHHDLWNLDGFRTRPLVICGYIDGILNSYSAKLKKQTNYNGINLGVGIGDYTLLGCNNTDLNEDFGMYTLSYKVTAMKEHA